MEAVDFGLDALSAQGGVGDKKGDGQAGGQTCDEQGAGQPAAQQQEEEAGGGRGEDGAECVKRKGGRDADQAPDVLPHAAHQQIERVAGGMGQTPVPGGKVKLAGIARQHVTHHAAQQQAERYGGNQEGDLAVQAPVGALSTTIRLSSRAVRFGHCAAIIR